MNAETLKELLANATPGPWMLGEEDDFDGIPVLYADGMVPVANVPNEYSDRDGRANATLIALAPELAADNIALQAEVERLREALEPFANVAEHDIGHDEADTDVFRPMNLFNRAPKIKVGDLRRARAALNT